MLERTIAEVIYQAKKQVSSNVARMKYQEYFIDSAFYFLKYKPEVDRLLEEEYDCAEIIIH